MYTSSIKNPSTGSEPVLKRRNNMSNVDASILYNFGLYSQSIPSEILRRIETLESTVENLKSELAIQKADNCKLRSEIHNLQTQLEGLEDLRPWTEALSKKVNRLATKPKVEGSKAEEHIEELYQVMKKNSLPSLSFSNAAKFLGLSKGWQV
jgi:chromosome segregation ATPase